ncbi:MAG TPA: LacI family DNA-binding transcriptional regulator [Gaiellaceae bacterium]|jgi:LacI family transcriptional regulator
MAETIGPTTETRIPARATIRDIAGLAGVSIATVSRVLNDRPDVAPHTREAVLRVVREHGFSTNRGARGLSSGRTGIVGTTLPHVNAEYFGTILSGAAEALYEEDMRIVLCPTLHEHEREVTLLERLMRGTTDGALLLLPAESTEELRALQRQGFPFVVVDPREHVPDGVPVVSAAHAAGAKEATEHLLSLGHRRIGAITGEVGWAATEERLLGFRAALSQYDLLPDASLIVPTDWQIPSGYEAAVKLLGRPDRPTAIFAFNDNVAVGVFQAARLHGLRVPDDLSIVGFDDLEEAQIVDPQLTTVRQPLAELGRMGASLLMRLIDRQRLDALRVELATKLIVRGSTAPPASV